jgi:DNA-binding PadR family transcriptional regulator
MPSSRTSDQPSRTSDLSMSMAILGLLIERPDTLGGIGIRLEQRFPDALWARSTPSNSMKGLLRKGHVRLVSGGGRSARDRYEPTSLGVAHFRQWKHESAVPRTLRDALQGKLAFSSPADLPRYIETREEELEDREQKYTDVHKRLLEAEALSNRLAAGGVADYDATMLCIKLADQARIWGYDMRRLRSLLKDLRGVCAEFPDSFLAGEVADG